jgi:hypothetical protein
VISVDLSPFKLFVTKASAEGGSCRFFSHSSIYSVDGCQKKLQLKCYRSYDWQAVSYCFDEVEKFKSEPPRPWCSPGSICRNISAILKFNLAPVFLSKILRSILSKNSAYQAWSIYLIGSFSGERVKRVVYRKIGISEMDISELRYIWWRHFRYVHFRYIQS